MIKLTQEMMRDLSFPDYHVQKMEFFREERRLKIFVEGGWIRISEGVGYDLGKGVLYFSDWESISIRRFHPQTDQWSLIEKYPVEPLRDLCDVSFSDSTVSLAGFGNQIGHWMEWIIVKPKMYAEFEEYKEDED